MEEAQLCCTRFRAALPKPHTGVSGLVKAGCPWPPPATRQGEQPSQGTLPSARKNSEVEREGKERERKEGKGERQAKAEKIRHC